MKALTKKQRREIYLAIATTLVEVGDMYNVYLCLELRRALKSLGLKFCDIKDYFPEFWLFNPMSFSTMQFTDPNEARLTCMLLCAEMCND